MNLIATNEELAAACQRFARHPFVAVDTEFLRETTFWPLLCVVQVASDDEALAIDALAEGLDLAPLFALMANESVVKVFHAARQDAEIFWKLAGVVPKPMFDTQVAAMVCGYGDQVSYSELVNSICHVSVDKSSRFTDWARRPLAQAQIDYAIGDVTYLRDIYRALLAKLSKSGRLSWLEDEMKILTSASTYEQHPENAWERLKNRARKPRDLAVLMELAAWREKEAQTRDVPRSRVLKDDVLVEIALAAPRSAEALANLRAFPRGMERAKAGAEILNAIEQGLARDPKTLPKLERDKRGPPGSAATVELLKVLLRQVCDQSGVAGKMIATVDDLEMIAADDRADVPALQGWRRNFVRRPGARTEARAAGADRRERQGRHAGMARRRGACRDRRKAGQIVRRPTDGNYFAGASCPRISPPLFCSGMDVEIDHAVGERLGLLVGQHGRAFERAGLGVDRHHHAGIGAHRGRAMEMRGDFRTGQIRIGPRPGQRLRRGVVIGLDAAHALGCRRRILAGPVEIGLIFQHFGESRRDRQRDGEAQSDAMTIPSKAT